MEAIRNNKFLHLFIWGLLLIVLNGCRAGVATQDPQARAKILNDMANGSENYTVNQSYKVDIEPQPIISKFQQEAMKSLNQGDYQNAEQLIDTAIRSIQPKQGYKVLLASCFNVQGVIYLQQRKFIEA